MKNVVKIILLAISVLLPFIAGLIALNSIWYIQLLSIVLLLLAVAALVVVEKFSQIKVGDEPPKFPSKGDLWIDTSDDAKK